MAEEAAARETKHRLTRTSITAIAISQIAQRAFLCTNVRAAGRPAYAARRVRSMRTRSMLPAAGKDCRDV